MPAVPLAVALVAFPERIELSDGFGEGGAEDAKLPQVRPACHRPGRLAHILAGRAIREVPAV